MRLLLLLLPLLVAGCTNPLAPSEDEVAPAGAPPAAPPAQTPSETAPAPDPEPTTAPASAPAQEPAAAPSPPPPPPPPAPSPWDLAAEARLGWVAGAGVGGAQGQAAQGQTDADHCPDATLLLPAGAKSLTFTLAAQPASAGSAGAYVVRVTAPDGTVSEMAGEIDPTTQTAHATLPIDAPLAGEWRLHAEPMGPVVQQVWTVTIAVSGESVGVPPTMTVTPAC